MRLLPQLATFHRHAEAFTDSGAKESSAAAQPVAGAAPSSELVAALDFVVFV